MSNLTIVLLILHFLGDFHLQSERMANEKVAKATELFKHLGVHALLLLIPAVFLLIRGNLPGLGILGLVLLGHMVLDLLKRLTTKKWKRSEPWLYVIDQLGHVLLIVVLGQVVFSGTLLQLPSFIQAEHLRWALLLVLVTKPANVTFKILFDRFRFSELLKEDTGTGKEEEIGAGALIGNLERILTAIFLSLGQAAAIGLIYTAKSIARFKQMEENKRFAEYYLIGTLYSILYVLVVYQLVIV